VADFQSPAGKTIAGRVVNAARQPLPSGGSVSVTRLGVQTFEVERNAELAADGSFVLEDIPDGRYQITANVPGYPAGGAAAEAGATGVEILVERRSVVTVKAVFPADADPSDVLEPVALLSNGVQTRREPLRPAAGWTATFDRVWPGEYDIEVVAGVWRGRREHVKVPDGEQVTYEIPVEKTLTLDAILVDADGEPVPGLQLVANPRGIAGARPQVVRTGPDGRFTVTGLAPGHWVLQASPEGRARLEKSFQIPLESSGTVRIALPAHGTLRIDAGGLSLEGAIVVLADANGEPVPAWVPEAASLGFRFRLPESGQLEIRGVPVGAVRVALSGGGLPRRLEREIDVVAGGSHVVEFR